jgi:uncharacterized iron-regulated protein
MRWLLLLVAAWPAWGGEITPEALDHLPPADVYILGEVHDSAAHHLNQARAVTAIAPSALVWEMLRDDQGPLVVMGAGLADLDAAIGWTGNGWPGLSLYYPIFANAGSARHYGAEVTTDALLDAIKGLPPTIAGYGLELPLSPDIQAEAEAEQAAAHCDALPQSKLPGMVAAQRLRDAALAQATMQAMADTGGPVVVITGTGHARRDRGVPAVLSHAAPGLRVVSVGQFEGDPGPDAPFDLWVVTPARGGPDPCDAFR